MSHGNSRPLRERPYDFFFILTFLLLALASFVPAGPTLIKSGPAAELWRGWYYRYVSQADPLVLMNPWYLRYRNLCLALLFGPFQLVLVYAFVVGKNWIRMPALMYTAAVTYASLELLYWEFWGPLTPTDPLRFWLWTLPFLFVPLLLAWRVRKAEPFRG